jgi:beta-lactamase regulating signal transducer with metallopeptidase domain
MMTLLVSWLAALAVASVKGSVLLLAGLASVRLMRRASAEARHAALALALGAFFILPLAGAIAPSWTIPVPASPGLVQGTGEQMEKGAAPSAPTEPLGAGTQRAGTPGRPGNDPSTSRDSRLAEGTPLRERIDWARAFVALWIAGSALIALRLLVGIMRLRFLSRRATMVTDGGWLHTAHALARRLGLTRGVTLLRGDREAVPMTWGVLSPVVWLPPASDEWPSALRRAVLSHELAHVRRRDAATQWLANAVVAVHWFNPLVWVAVRALRAERERACDDAVLSLGVEADDYASQLLDMVRTLGGSGGPAPAMAMARRSQFEGRLLAILDHAVSRAPVGSARLAALSAMAGALVLVLGGMRGITASEQTAGDRQARLAIENAAAPADTHPTSVARHAGDARKTAAATTPPSGRPASDPIVPAQRKHALVTAPQADVASLARAVAGTSASSEPAVTVDSAPGTGEVTLPPAPALPAAPPRTDTASSRAPTPTELLRAMQATTRRDTALMLEIIAAAEGISSSIDRVAVLERMAKRPNLEPEVVLALGSAAGRVTSTSERAKLLKAMIQTQEHAVGGSRRTVLDAIGSMSTSVEPAMLLVEFIGRPNLSDSSLSDALATTQKISSSNEKAKVLIAAARLRTIEGDVRASYLKSARSITNDSDRARTLSALFDGPGGEPAERRPPTTP